MSWIRYVPPPPPPDGTQHCLVCLMAAKHALAETHQDKIKKAIADGDDKRVCLIPWDSKLMLEPAIATGLSSDAPELGMIPACWTHLSWVEVNRSPLVRGQQLPPGLVAGSG